MKVAISNIDALKLYRAKPEALALNKQRVSLPKNFTPCASVEEVLLVHDEFGLSIPVHCIVPADVNRRQSACLRCTVMSKKVCDESFLSLGSDSYLCSPELCVFTLKSDLSPAELAQVISEFCGGYSLPLDPKEAYYERKPLSSLSAMLEFASGAAHVKGIKNMRIACQLAFDNSNSPMETALALLLSLPPNMGGYGLAKPKLNEAVSGFHGKRPISFVRTGRSVRGVRYGDLVYEDAHLVVEYLSKQHHEGRWDSDALRNNELKAAGFDVFSVTPAQIYDLAEADDIAGKIARRLGQNLPKPTPEWRGRNMHLRECLGISGRIVD